MEEIVIDDFNTNTNLDTSYGVSYSCQSIEKINYTIIDNLLKYQRICKSVKYFPVFIVLNKWIKQDVQNKMTDQLNLKNVAWTYFVNLDDRMNENNENDDDENPYCTIPQEINLIFVAYTKKEDWDAFLKFMIDDCQYYNDIRINKITTLNTNRKVVIDNDKLFMISCHYPKTSSIHKLMEKKISQFKYLNNETLNYLLHHNLGEQIAEGHFGRCYLGESKSGVCIQGFGIYWVKYTMILINKNYFQEPSLMKSRNFVVMLYCLYLHEYDDAIKLILKNMKGIHPTYRKLAYFNRHVKNKIEIDDLCSLYKGFEKCYLQYMKDNELSDFYERLVAIMDREEVIEEVEWSDEE